jgi:hypothetical protein
VLARMQAFFIFESTRFSVKIIARVIFLSYSNYA